MCVLYFVLTHWTVLYSLEVDQASVLSQWKTTLTITPTVVLMYDGVIFNQAYPSQAPSVLRTIGSSLLRIRTLPLSFRCTPVPAVEINPTFLSVNNRQLHQLIHM